jgi:hypothetical protein
LAVTRYVEQAATGIYAMPDPLERACALVGRFQYHFGRLEQKVDEAVLKLFDLDEKAGPIVTRNVDFAKKVDFVRTWAAERATDPAAKDLAKRTAALSPHYFFSPH